MNVCLGARENLIVNMINELDNGWTDAVKNIISSLYTKIHFDWVTNQVITKISNDRKKSSKRFWDTMHSVHEWADDYIVTFNTKIKM